MKSRCKTQGFTFIELTIVLVIIALIIGAILMGQTLIRSAQLRSVMDDVDGYKKAVILFKDQYHELPGDMPNATAFWGSAAGCPTPTQTNIAQVATCNGNGDGVIGPNYTGGSLSAPWYTLAAEEIYTAWQQLADAGLIKGSYTGTASFTYPYSNLPGINFPSSKIPKAGYILRYIQPLGATTGVAFQANYRHVIMFGMPSPSPVDRWYPLTVAPLFPALTPVEAMSIDQKIDDGMPGTGNVLAFTQDSYTSLAGGNNNCTNSNSTSAATATYQTQVTGLQCALIFITGF